MADKQVDTDTEKPDIQNQYQQSVDGDAVIRKPAHNAHEHQHKQGQEDKWKKTQEKAP